MWGNDSLGKQFYFDADAGFSEEGSDQMSVKSHSEPSYLEQFQELKFAALRRTAQRQAVELSKTKGRCVVCTLPLPCVKHASHQKWDTAFAPAKLERTSITESEPKNEPEHGLESEPEAEAPSTKEDLAKKAEVRRRNKIRDELAEYHRKKEEEEKVKQQREQEAKKNEAAENAEKERKRKEHSEKLKRDLQKMQSAKEEEERKKAEEESKAAIAKKKRDELEKKLQKEQQAKVARWQMEKEMSKEVADAAKPAPASPRGGAPARSAAAKSPAAAFSL